MLDKVAQILGIKQKETAPAPDMRDMTEGLQIFLNSIHDVTEHASWDLSRWSLRDLQQFMDATEQLGRRVS